ncbi:MAG: SIMPL domain-containing protein [Candidatus Daviesbacteria bacterium]|nr:SIMPL domain-containing protein [Candidatus Daviesbacteria bacterium]
MLKQIGNTAATLVIFFILLFVYTKFIGPIPFQVNSTSTTKTTTFDVTGEGKSTVKPDFVSISAGISATGSTTKEVQDQINVIINKVTENIKALGIDSKDIQTSNYSINPTYDYRDGSQKITGYSANTTLTIKVRDLGKAGQVIDTATKAGANNVNNLGFDTTDKTAAENEARTKAVAAAKKKAEDAAKIAGFSLGKIVNYNENTAGSPILRAMGIGGADKVASPETTLQPGSNEVIVAVTLSYEIR